MRRPVMIALLLLFAIPQAQAQMEQKIAFATAYDAREHLSAAHQDFCKARLWGTPEQQQAFAAELKRAIKSCQNTHCEVRETPC